MWALHLRYRDVLAALHDVRFSADRVTHMRALARREELRPFFDFIGNRMVFCDPPQHSRLRALLNKAFTPHAVEAMRPRVQQLVDQIIDRAQGQGGMDVIGDLAFPLPATVIALLLGLPPADIGRLKTWSDEFVVFFSSAPAAITPEQYHRAAQAAEAMTQYFRSALEQIKQPPEDTLLGAMELAEEAGDRLSEVELFANANLLLVAGHETTTNLIGNGMLALLQYPDQLRRLREGPGLVPQAIEERAALRQSGAVHQPGGPGGPRHRRPTHPERADASAGAGGGESRPGTVRGAGPAGRDANAEPPRRFRAEHPLLPGRAAGPDGGTDRLHHAVAPRRG